MNNGIFFSLAIITMITCLLITGITVLCQNNYLTKIVADNVPEKLELWNSNDTEMLTSESSNCEFKSEISRLNDRIASLEQCSRNLILHPLPPAYTE